MEPIGWFFAGGLILIGAAVLAIKGANYLASMDRAVRDKLENRPEYGGRESADE